MEMKELGNLTLEQKLQLPIKRLDLGCGLNRKDPVDDWIHMDFDYAPGIDIVGDWKKIPLPDECIDFLWSSETLEHIPLFELDETLKEWSRVLKIGAVCEFTTPNLDFTIKAAYEGLRDTEWIMRNLYGDQINYELQHYTLYNPTTINELLMKYGFSECQFNNAWGATDSRGYEWLAFTTTKIKNVN